MTTDNLTEKLAELASDVAFLAQHARCPDKQCALLKAWSASIFAHEETAFAKQYLSDVVDALVTLAHSNVAISRSFAPPFARKGALDFDDTGGYFAARRAIASIICLLPIDDDLRSALAQHALRRIDHDLRGLEKLIPG